METWLAVGGLEVNTGSTATIIESSGAATKLIDGRWLLRVGNGSLHEGRQFELGIMN